MTLDKLLKIFKVFFGERENKGIQVISDNFKSKLYTIEYTVKNVVDFDKDQNHLNVYTIDLETNELYTTIIEGSPEDIIKLSKILQS